MSQLKSVFGPYADRIQVMIDSSKDKFAPTWHQNYFGMGTPQATLTFQSIIGASRIEAAASVVSRDSETPIRSRPTLNRLSGEIPAIKEMFKLSESDYREFMIMKSLPVSDETKKNQILDFIFNDVLKAGNAAHKRVDIMAMEAVSKGTISLTLANNPDGLILDTPMDLLMPAENRQPAAVQWTTPNAATSTPLKDINTIVKLAKAKGITFGKMIMSDAVWYQFQGSKEVQDTMLTFQYGPKVSGTPTASATIDLVNDYLTKNRLPIIETNGEVIGIEKDGKITTFTPFDQKVVSFVPNGPLGVIKNALAIEQMQPVANLSYANYKGALISKWNQNEPFAEFTKSEFNAAPAFESIDSCYILTVLP